MSAFRRWLEAIFGFIAGGLVFACPYIIESSSDLKDTFSGWFIADKPISDAFSIGLFLLGVMITLGRRDTERLIDRKLEAEKKELTAKFERVDNLAAVVQLSNEAPYGQMSDLVNSYSRITDPVLTTVKLSLVDDLLRQLQQMSDRQMTPSLPLFNYTSLEEKTLRSSCGTSERVRALSTLFDGDFDEVPTNEEVRFIQANLALIESGVDFERLFVVPAQFYSELVRRPSVRRHVGSAGRPSIRAQVVFYEELSPVDQSRLPAGFLIFGSRIGFLDQVDGNRLVRGSITANSLELQGLHNLYDSLSVKTHRLDLRRHPLTGERLSESP